MCKMNCWCSVTIICIVLIAALILTNSFEVHVSRKQDGKSEHQLNDFRANAYKTRKDLEVWENFAEFIEQHGNRHRRQAKDWFDTFDGETDKEKYEEEQIQPNCNPDLCKARNCAGALCREESSKHFLKPSKELKMFLNNLKVESKNMPREISLDESEVSNNEPNGEEENEAILREEKNSEEKQERVVINDRQTRLKLKGGNTNDLRFRWSPNGEKSDIKQNSNFVKENQVDSDLSSCQQCSQSRDKNVSDNCKQHKEPRPNVNYGSTKFSKNPEKAKANQMFLNDLDRKYHKKEKTATADKVDDNDDDEDELYHIENVKLSPSQSKAENYPYEFKQPALKASKYPENSPLSLQSLAFNDQLEVTKNNLSHEADYKLSKYEQNASENKKQVLWKWGIFKRSHPFNAMHEIKLKTSQRLMKKGFGASLPSYALAENRQDLFIDTKLRQREKEIFRQNSNSKYNKQYDENNNIELNFGTNKNQLEDLPQMPLELDSATLLLNDWGKTRHKTINEVNNRYKRELGIFNDQSSTEAFQYEKLAEHQALRSLLNKPKTVKKLKDISKTFKAKACAEHNFPKALKIQINATKNKMFQKLEKAFKLDKKLLAIKMKDSKQKLAKALSIKQNEAKELTANNYISNEKLSLFNINKLQPLRAFSVLENETHPINHYFKNENPVKRVKRSLLPLLVKQPDVDNQNSNFISLNKPENAEKSSDLRFSITQNFLPQTLKSLKRTKRFNPCQTINLKIYQKHHEAKALKRKKHQRILDQTNKKQNKARHKRAITCKSTAKSSAGSKNFIEKAANLLKKKAIQLRKNMDNFFKTSLKYLTFQKENSTNFKAPTTESSVSSVLKTKSNGNGSLVAENQKLQGTKFRVEATKRCHKTNNPKLRFLQDFLSNFNGRLITEPLRTTRSAATLIAKTQQNSNYWDIFEGNIKTISNKGKKSSRDPLMEIRYNKNVQSSTSFLKKKDKDTGLMASCFNLTKLRDEESRPQKLPNTSNLMDDMFFVTNEEEKKSAKNKFENFKQILNFNKSWDKQIMKDQNGFNLSNLKIEVNHNCKAGQSFSYKITKTKAFESSTEFIAGNSNVKNSKNLGPKVKSNSTLKASKRAKRSLEKAFQDKHRKSDALNRLKRRDYFFQYGDFYKPENKPGNSIQINSKLHINDDKSPKLSTNAELPANQAINLETYYKALNTEKFDDVKNYNPQSKQFDSMSFDNVWPAAESQYGHFKQQKRFLNNPDSKKFQIKTTKGNFPLEPTKLPAQVQTLKDKYLKDLQNFNKNYKFNANQFNWPGKNAKSKTNFNINSTMDYAEKLGLELHNEILNCKAFDSLEDFIKSLPKNLTQPLLSGNSTTEKIEVDLNTLSTTAEATTTMRPLMPQSTGNCLPATEIPETTEPIEMDLELTSEAEPQNEEYEETYVEPTEEYTGGNVTTSPTAGENVKLNISINAHVQGNPKDQHYSGNGSFNVTAGLLDDRLRRDLKLSPLEKTPQQFLHLPNQESKDEDIEDLSELISGKFSSKAVKAIFTAVQENPHLRDLWPSLDPSQKFEPSHQQNFYAIRNQETEPQLSNSEKLIAQAMSAINAIVEQQARSHLCVPLRPDLQKFYNMIVQTRQQQDLLRAKRQNVKSAEKQNFSYQLHLLDPSKIEEKTKIVKKLLNQYEQLPQEDQQQVAALRDDLLKNLIVLRQLQDNEERQGNELREKRENDWAASDEKVLKSLQSEYSSQFLKLLKAADLYREIKND